MVKRSLARDARQPGPVVGEHSKSTDPVASRDPMAQAIGEALAHDRKLARDEIAKATAPLIRRIATLEAKMAAMQKQRRL